MMVEAGPDPGSASLIFNERIKLTAAYLNAAGSCFTAGVVAPLAAALFGVGGPAIPLLTLGVGVLIFLGASVGLHALGRTVLRRLQP